ncbi:MAG: DNA-directed RNA polymerase subunit beta, partial [Spirochaetota bacterium]
MRKTKKVINFGKINPNIELPNLVEVQLNSYDWFLQSELPQQKRKYQGIQSIFSDIFPIESPHEDVVLEFIDYEIGDPKYSEAECKERDVTYASPLKATIRLIKKDSMEVREQSVYMGDIPLMTSRGTFIINGAERVVVNQLHRSPGIFFGFDEIERIYSSRVIPDKGSWLEIEVDSKGFIIARIDRKKKFPVTILIKALGYETNEDIIKLFYETETVELSDDMSFDNVLTRRVASDIVSPETGEILIEAGSRINIDTIDIFRDERVTSVELVKFPNNKDDAFLVTTLQKDFDMLSKQHVDDSKQLTSSQIALMTIHEI